MGWQDGTPVESEKKQPAWMQGEPVSQKSSYVRPPDALDNPDMASENSALYALQSGAGGLRDIGMGAVRGAGAIGSTLLWPVDAAKDAITGKTRPTLSSLVTGKAPQSSHEERVAGMDSFMRENADPSSLGFKEGELAAQIAGTAGVGGALAKGAALAGAPRLSAALASGGFNLGGPGATTAAGKVGDMALRVGAGAAVGGASAGLVDPSTAGTGAILGVALPVAAKVAGDLGGKLAGKATQAAGEMAQNATRDATLKAGQEAGYVVPPSTTNPGIVNRTVESIGGKAAVGQAASIQNQKVTNALARQELGLGENAPLSDKLLEDYRKTVSAPYKEVAALPTMPTQRTAAGVPFPVGAPPPQAPAKALHDLQQARFEANAYWNEFRRTGQVASRDKAQALSANAEKLESYLEQTAIAAGKPDLVDALRAARQKIAKSYTVQGALNGSTGDVSAQDLAKMLNNNKPLGEHLEVAARFADAFPKANQDVAGIGSQGVSKVAATVATILGGGGLAAGGPLGGAAGAAIPFIAPAAAKSLALSKLYQGAMATPSYGALSGSAAAGLNSVPKLGENAALRALMYRQANQSNH